MTNVKKKNIALAAFVFFFLFLFLALKPHFAEATSFNPHLLVSDYDFTHSNSMSATEINSFFCRMGSTFCNYKIPSTVQVPFPYRDSSGNAKWGTVSVSQNNVSWSRTYTGGGFSASKASVSGKTVAQLIAEETVNTDFFNQKLNPQVILATLQKESSSITRSISYSQTLMAWPVFFGFDDSLANYRYTYDQAKSIALTYGGMGRQIVWSIWWFKKIYKYGYGTWDTSWNWKAGFSVACTLKDASRYVCPASTITVYPKSKSTRVLYYYTPYVGNGNYNFWYYFQKWFGYSFGPVPGASLYKYGTTYYLVYNNKKYSLGSSTTRVKSFGFDPYSATTMSSEQYSSFSSGGSLSNYIVYGGRSYLVAGGLKYYVWPTATFKKRWGLYGQTPTSVPADLFGAIPAAPRNLTAVIKSPYSDSIYYIDRGGRRFYVWPSDTFKTRWGIKNEDVVVMPDSFVRSLPYAGRLTGLVRGETISQVYYIDRGGRKYPVWPTDIFWGRWGFNRDFDVVTISDAQLRWMTTERWLTGLVRGDQDGQLYWIDNVLLEPVEL